MTDAEMQALEAEYTETLAQAAKPYVAYNASTVLALIAEVRRLRALEAHYQWTHNTEAR